MKNENVKDDLLFCLRQYHTLCEGDDGELNHKLRIGKQSQLFMFGYELIELLKLLCISISDIGY